MIGDIYRTLRTNWRSTLLTVMILLSAVALFAPSGALGLSADTIDGPTNLQYGIQLDGGTRIRAPVVGMTAENLEVPATEDNPDFSRQDVVDSVTGIEGVDAGDMAIREGDRRGTLSVELFLPENNVSRQQFADAISEGGLPANTGDVRSGVTGETRSEIVKTIDQKINQAGLSGASVSQTSTVGGGNFVVIESPNLDPADIRDLVAERGEVEIVARYPVEENGTVKHVNETVLTSDDLTNNADPGSATNDQQTGETYVPVTLTNDETAEKYTRILTQRGFTNEGVSRCPRDWRNASGETWCLLTVSDGDVVYSAGVAPGLANEINSGGFVDDPRFRMLTEQMGTAQRLQIHLQAGRLRAPLDFQRSSETTLEPALASRFKFNSLVTGIVAVLGVCLAVYVRYRDVRVAAPMVVTALSEVVILLGFAAAIKLPLDLSHIAGFIAVIGTGVDDLIIIADEVMSEGDVDSGRVFRSRFRKAFWVIGAAAATTIIAMSPLWYLGVGDLQGFAIITILGVLIGVLVTRPAYGDILRSLITEH